MSANPVIGVLSLQGGVSEHLHALESAGASAVLVRRPQDVAGVDGLVIPGGESTVIDKLSRVFEVDGPIRERIAAGLPVYGSCAGMIMLADELADAAAGQRTFGGLDVLVRRNAFGRQVESFEEDLPFSGLAEAGLDDAPVRAAFIRAPWVERVGEGVEVLARVTEGPAAGVPVAVRQGRLLATSFHPEITGDHRVHALFVHLVRSA